MAKKAPVKRKPQKTTKKKAQNVKTAKKGGKQPPSPLAQKLASGKPTNQEKPESTKKQKAKKVAKVKKVTGAKPAPKKKGKK